MSRPKREFYVTHDCQFPREENIYELPSGIIFCLTSRQRIPTHPQAEGPIHELGLMEPCLAIGYPLSMTVETREANLKELCEAISEPINLPDRLQKRPSGLFEILYVPMNITHRELKSRLYKSAKLLDEERISTSILSRKIERRLISAFQKRPPDDSNSEIYISALYRGLQKAGQRVKEIRRTTWKPGRPKVPLGRNQSIRDQFMQFRKAGLSSVEAFIRLRKELKDLDEKLDFSFSHLAKIVGVFLPDKLR